MIDEDSRPPVQDSAKTIVSFLFFNSFITTLAKLSSFSPKINFDFLNGSEFYLANYLVLSFYCIVLKYKNSKRLKILFFAFILFNISLIFRTIDNFICEKFIWGTHYFWHLINAYLLQILTYIVLQIKPNYLRKIKI